MNSMATHPGHSDVVTRGVRVQVGAQFLPDESDAESRRYTYAYRVIITNESEIPLRILARHWIIYDANNNRRDVRGQGVVGEQPLLEPGESFEYLSGCPLKTAWGTMEGSYRVERDDGEIVDVAIGRFFLAPSAAPLSLLGVPAHGSTPSLP